MTNSRRAHYQRFFETDPPPSDDLLVVIGNCQAESVRLLLDPEGVRSVRVPPVFELDAAEAALLERLLPRVRTLVSQPVRDGYRDLAVGTAELAAQLSDGARLVTMPIVRYVGLHPFHVVVHSGVDDDGHRVALPQPPVVPYHDLRVVAAALGHRLCDGGTSPDAVRAVAEQSLSELRRRESRTDVQVSAALAAPGVDHMRTVNHPGNPVLLALAGAVAGVLGLAAPQDPGRPLLDALRAPIEAAVAAAWNLDLRPEPPCWLIDGARVPAEQVAVQQLAWYAEHPHVAASVWKRHRATAAVLGIV